MKSKGKSSTNFLTSRNLMDNTQYLAFLPSDFAFDEASMIKDKKTKINHKTFLTHAVSQYKCLLELDQLTFWSTLQFNPYLTISLDSFLRCARRQQFNVFIPKTIEDTLTQNITVIDKDLHFLYSEISRLIFLVYHRIIADIKQYSVQKVGIDIPSIIYENWIFDIPKFLDICSIYGSARPDLVKSIIENVFIIEPGYLEDYKNMINEIIKKILPDKANLINRQRKRDERDLSTLTSDMQEKIDLLMQIYDILKSLKFVVVFFPSECFDYLFYEKKFILTLENLYMIIRTSYKVWKISDDMKEFVKFLINQIYNDIFEITVNVFKTIFDKTIAKDFSKNPKTKKVWQQLEIFLCETGSTTLKKKDEEPNYKFLEKLIKKMPSIVFYLQSVPEGIMKEENIQQFQILIMNLNELDEKAKNSLKEQDETNNELEEQIKLIQEISEINEIEKGEKAKVEITLISEEKVPEKKNDMIKIVDVHVGKKYLLTLYILKVLTIYI